ncbi:MAG: PAS domain S-box protein [Lentisphaerae bacterium]|nr:PAS domain S-box protein [Lentisphaerota bacterium]
MPQMRINRTDIPDADIFEILLDNFPDIIQSVDDGGNIVFINAKAEKLLGYTRDELLGMNIRQIYAEEVLEALEAGFSDLKRTGDYTVESLIKAKDGTRIPVEIRSFGIYDDNGRFLRTFSILRDIRVIKELRDGLVHAGRLAAIGELASGVAHDINNPLTVVLLSNEMLTRSLQAGKPPAELPVEKLQGWSRDIGKACKSIQKLADHLRGFSRGMAEKMEAVDLHDTVADALFMTNNKVMAARVTVESAVRKGRHYVTGCPNRLEQVLVNLVGNACDAMADRERRDLKIAIEPEVRDGTAYWRCDVSDTGGGIPPEHLDDVFQSFFTTKEKGKGTGLGLSISRGIVGEHKGMIEVRSAVGQGTTFSVLLPQAGA